MTKKHPSGKTPMLKSFPPLEAASPQGLLAVGGDLDEARLLEAYRSGIFPWYGAGEPILWWSPDPRCVIFPAKFKLSRSLKKSIRQSRFRFTLDTAFARVVDECSKPRHDSRRHSGNDPGTWITAEMAHAYLGLHRSGIAHSVEIWQPVPRNRSRDQSRDQPHGKLIGGLYGLAIGGVFFGESMFSRVRDSSKVALALLIELLLQWDFRLIDCQVVSAHLLSLGAEVIPRSEFIEQMEFALTLPGKPGNWSAVITE